MVMVEPPGPTGIMTCGLKLTVTPGGAPDDERLMEPLKPPLGRAVMSDVPWLPGATVRDAGDADRLKSPDAARGKAKHRKLRTQSKTIVCRFGTAVPFTQVIMLDSDVVKLPLVGGGKPAAERLANLKTDDAEQQREQEND